LEQPLHGRNQCRHADACGLTGGSKGKTFCGNNPQISKKKELDFTDTTRENPNIILINRYIFLKNTSREKQKRR